MKTLIKTILVASLVGVSFNAYADEDKGGCRKYVGTHISNFGQTVNADTGVKNNYVINLSVHSDNTFTMTSSITLRDQLIDGYAETAQLGSWVCDKGVLKGVAVSNFTSNSIATAISPGLFNTFDENVRYSIKLDGKDLTYRWKNIKPDASPADRLNPSASSPALLGNKSEVRSLEMTKINNEKNIVDADLVP